MIYNPVIMRKYCQIGMRYRCITTSQYFGSSATKSLRKLDKLMLFYHMVSYTRLCLWRVFTITQKFYVLNRFPMPTFNLYLWARERLEHRESYILRNPMLWYRSCRNFKGQFVTGEWKPWGLWQYVSAYPSMSEWDRMAFRHFWQAGDLDLDLLQTTKQHVAWG